MPTNYMDWEFKPLKLSPEERENPLTVLDDFFGQAHLPEWRIILWDWLKATVTGGYSKILDRRERNSIVFYYEYIEKLVEAAHLIRQQQKAAKP